MALVTLLLQPPDSLPDVLILDEPELGLHPYAINIIGSLINRFVGKQKQCIDATSHLFLHFNPYLNKHTLIEIN